MRAMSKKKYDPNAAFRKYREVIRPAKGIGAKRGTYNKLYDRDELKALRLLAALDRHIAKVDQLRINRHLPLVFKVAKPKGRLPLYSEPERRAITFIKSLRRVRRFCRACGNDRKKNPDLDGHCRVCKLRRGAYFKKKHRHKPKSKAARRVARSRRRARLRAAPINDLTAKGEAWVFHLYGTKCLRCGAEPTALDHVVPLASGGPHTASNLQPLCWVCNSSKCSRSCADYRPFPYYPQIQ